MTLFRASMRKGLKNTKSYTVQLIGTHRPRLREIGRALGIVARMYL